MATSRSGKMLGERSEVRGRKEQQSNPGLLVSLIYERSGAFDGVGGGACQRKVRSGGACTHASQL